MIAEETTVEVIVIVPEKPFADSFKYGEIHKNTHDPKQSQVFLWKFREYKDYPGQKPWQICEHRYHHAVKTGKILSLVEYRELNELCCRSE